jgi:flavodoxin I
MKILITYYSETGNTEKVAKAMKEGLDEEGQEVTLLPAKDCDPSSLGSYDLVLFGSCIIGGSPGKSSQNIIRKVTELSPQIAFFYTHGSNRPYPKAFKRLDKKLEQSNTKVLGTFECIGENLTWSEEEQLNMVPPDKREQAKKYMDSIKGRPNEEDLAEAKKFAKSLIK